MKEAERISAGKPLGSFEIPLTNIIAATTHTSATPMTVPHDMTWRFSLVPIEKVVGN
jgi:hypothetical protein